MAQKTNPYNLPQWYLDESSSVAFERLRAGKYRTSDYSAVNDVNLILTHYYEDVKSGNLLLPFYAKAFQFIFIKAYGQQVYPLPDGTFSQPLPDIYIKHVLDALEAYPHRAWLPVLADMQTPNSRYEFADVWKRVLSLVVKIEQYSSIYVQARASEVSE